MLRRVRPGKRTALSPQQNGSACEDADPALGRRHAFAWVPRVYSGCGENGLPSAPKEFFNTLPCYLHHSAAVSDLTRMGQTVNYTPNPVLF